MVEGEATTPDLVDEKQKLGSGVFSLDIQANDIRCIVRTSHASRTHRGTKRSTLIFLEMPPSYILSFVILLMKLVAPPWPTAKKLYQHLTNTTILVVSRLPGFLSSFLCLYASLPNRFFRSDRSKRR